MARVSLELDTLPIHKRIEQFSPKAREYIGASVDFASQTGMRDMKRKAPWTDRTGNARNGLFTAPSTGVGGNDWTILFSHSVTYGIWLEIRNNGKYAIIMPTVLRTGNDLMRHLKQMFRELDKQ